MTPEFVAEARRAYVPAAKWARANGAKFRRTKWSTFSDSRWIKDESCVIWNRPWLHYYEDSLNKRFEVRPTSIQQAVDYLVAADVLPAELASWAPKLVADPLYDLMDTYNWRWRPVGDGTYIEWLTKQTATRAELEAKRGPIVEVAHKPVVAPNSGADAPGPPAIEENEPDVEAKLTGAVDLMAALRASLDRAKTARSGGCSICNTGHRTIAEAQRCGRTSGSVTA